LVHLFAAIGPVLRRDHVAGLAKNAPRFPDDANATEIWRVFRVMEQHVVDNPKVKTREPKSSLVARVLGAKTNSQLDKWYNRTVYICGTEPSRKGFRQWCKDHPSKTYAEMKKAWYSPQKLKAL